MAKKNEVKLFGLNKKFMAMPCPKCGQRMKFLKSNSFFGVKTLGKRYEIPNMYMLLRTCPNPMCEWNEMSGDNNEIKNI